MKTEGFFSLEALACIFLLSCAILSVSFPRSHDVPVLAHQKLNDLLLVWRMNESSPEEILSDSEFFLGENYCAEINGSEHGSCESGEFVFAGCSPCWRGIDSLRVGTIEG